MTVSTDRDGHFEGTMNGHEVNINVDLGEALTNTHHDDHVHRGACRDATTSSAPGQATCRRETGGRGPTTPSPRGRRPMTNGCGRTWSGSAW